MTIDPGQKYLNEYYIEKYLREYERTKLTREEAVRRLEVAGYITYEGGKGTLGYRGFGQTGIIFGTDPETINRIVQESYIDRVEPHEPIVLKDTYLRIWNWLCHLITRR